LVKPAFYGADPNSGLIFCSVGNSGVDFDPQKIDIAVGEIEIVRGGVGLGAEAERRAHEVMRRGEYILRVHLHHGKAQGRHTTCDLGVDYVKLNADYRS
jgi:glutamate N-acetyltransferase/amino-acid N-acetyltransferase